MGVLLIAVTCSIILFSLAEWVRYRYLRKQLPAPPLYWLAGLCGLAVPTFNAFLKLQVGWEQQLPMSLPAEIPWLRLLVIPLGYMLVWITVVMAYLAFTIGALKP